MGSPTLRQEISNDKHSIRRHYKIAYRIARMVANYGLPALLNGTVPMSPRTDSAVKIPVALLKTANSHLRQKIRQDVIRDYGFDPEAEL